jgi:tetratricopeptide (TPR) repeat protein
MRCLALVLVVLSAACARTVQPDKQAFYELRSEHFLLRTSVPKDDAAETLVELERVRATLVKFVASNAPPPVGRMHAIQLASADELEEFLPEGVIGVADDDVFGRPVAVMVPYSKTERLSVLQHELAHLVSLAVIPRQPRWFGEGLACYFETIRHDRATDTMVIGEPHRDRLTYLDATFRRGHLSIGAALGGPANYWSYGAFEAAAWLLVHWLQDRHSAAFDSYMDLLYAGEPADAAFRKAFPGLDSRKIDAAMEVYFGMNAQFGTLSVPAPHWSGTISARRLAAAEVRALRAQLFTIAGRHRDAESEVVQALKLDPAEPEALAVRGKLPKMDASTRLASARAAVKAHPDDVRAWLLLLEVLPKKADPERHQAVEAALRADPQEPIALVAGAWDALDAGNVRESLSRARNAVRFASQSADALEALAAASAADGRCPDALETLDRALEVVPPRAPKDVARRIRERRARIAAGSANCPAEAKAASDAQPATR